MSVPCQGLQPPFYNVLPTMTAIQLLCLPPTIYPLVFILTPSASDFNLILTLPLRDHRQRGGPKNCGCLLRNFPSPTRTLHGKIASPAFYPAPMSTPPRPLSTSPHHISHFLLKITDHFSPAPPELYIFPTLCCSAVYRLHGMP